MEATGLEPYPRLLNRIERGLSHIIRAGVSKSVTIVLRRYARAFSLFVFSNIQRSAKRMHRATVYLTGQRVGCASVLSIKQKISPNKPQHRPT